MSGPYCSLDYTTQEINHFYNNKTYYETSNYSDTTKAQLSKLDNFDVEPLINTAPINISLHHGIVNLQLDQPVPLGIVRIITSLLVSDNDPQSVIECTANELKKILESSQNLGITNYGSSDPNCFINDYIAREITLFMGGYCWDGEFMGLQVQSGLSKEQTNFKDVRIKLYHKYVEMNRIAYYCGRRDVIYCKSDIDIHNSFNGLKYSSKYFVEIKVDHKNDEMWMGIVFNDIERFSSYRREKNQIAYYGGRLSTTNNLIDSFIDEYPELGEKYDAQSYKIDRTNMHKLSHIRHYGKETEKSTKQKPMIEKEKDEDGDADHKHDEKEMENETPNGRNGIDFEQCILDNGSQLGLENYTDIGVGNIQGRSEIKSVMLPWYGSGDIIGILVDIKDGIVYFYKNGSLVWYVSDNDIKDPAKKCKVFGCTDSWNDCLIFHKSLWNDQREQDLQKQIQILRQKHPKIQIDRYVHV